MTAALHERFDPLWSYDIVLTQARDLLADAEVQPAPADRFRIAHLAALRATAAVLSAYTEPGHRLARRPTSAWVLLSKLIPPLAPWAAYFAGGASQRAAADAGVSTAVSDNDADELLVAVRMFLELCASLVRLAGAGGAGGAALEELDRLPAPPRRQLAAMARAG